MKTGHEVNDDVVGEQSNGRERQVGEQVGDWVGGTSVHTITGLKVVTDQDNERWWISRESLPVYSRSHGPSS